jgi:3-deoxy-D-manno-octulosonic-acid transferase
MLLLYNIGLFLYKILVITASVFNKKAGLFVTGRKNLAGLIAKQIDPSKKHIWFHFASLGEFEQGRPVLEEIKQKHPEKRIVVTFFSPSGYEIRKNYALAEGVFYLPLDTRKNAEDLISLINPEIAVFTKYEFWYYYFKTLHDRQIPLLLISGIFRPEQVFFKWYGGFYRRMLSYVTHYFVQNMESVDLLRNIGISDVSLSGDTRFDRVAANAASPKKLPLIEAFCGDAPVFIAGSTWPQDEVLLKALFEQPQGTWKLIIAPHEIAPSHLAQVSRLFPEAVSYTSLQAGGNYAEKQVLIVDNIGMLSSIYQYATIAYIGGGFGSGIHNTLEAAAFGLPVIFGPKYDKFQEAKDLLALGAAISISTAEDLSAAFLKLQKDSDAGTRAKAYVAEKTGSTTQIVKFLEQYN